MIIGFDGSRASAGRRTGTENYSYQLLKALAKIDKKNQYLVYLRPNYSSNKVRSYHKNYNIFKEGSRLHSNDIKEWPENFQFKIINWSRLWTQGGLALETFKDKPDVLFVPAHTLPVIRKPGLKTVVTVHDLGSEYLPSMHQVKQRLYLGFMQKFQLKTATKIIAVSKATKKDLVKKVGIDPGKVSVVYEGYDREKFKIQSSKFKINQTIKKYNLMYQNYFLFVGTVQPRKNLERLIRAFSVIEARQLKSDFTIDSPHFLVARDFAALYLVIAGSKGWMNDEIYQLPRKLGIEDRVKFLGYVPDKDLPYLYSGAIALTFPSLFEGFGLPILEAQACGCPVLTSNVSSMPEVAGPPAPSDAGPAGGGAVYVDPYSIDDIVEGMRKVQSSSLDCARDKKFKVQSVKAGFENVKRFSWEKCARETLKVLEML